MICPRCKSQFVNIQVVTEAKLKNVHHGIFWWLLIGWWWVPIKWLYFTVPALFFKVFGHKKQRIEQTYRSLCICQNCGYQWMLR